LYELVDITTTLTCQALVEIGEKLARTSFVAAVGTIPEGCSANNGEPLSRSTNERLSTKAQKPFGGYFFRIVCRIASVLS
jgi:hypothetical protein